MLYWTLPATDMNHLEEQDAGFSISPPSETFTEPRKPAGIHRSRYDTDPTHREEQRDLFRKRDSLRILSHELEQTDGEEIDRLESIKRDIGSLEHNLIICNLPLLVRVARKFYLTKGETLSPDLIQEGFFGLKKAVENFDVGRGYKFSTYAYPKIRQAISRAVDNTVDTIRLPIWVSAALKRIQKIQTHLTKELGREPAAEEISSVLPDLSPRRISSLLMYKTTSNVDMMDREEDHDEDSFFGIHHHNGHGPLRLVEKIFIEAEEAELPNLVPIISPEEQQVLALFFEENLTFKEIGSIIKKSHNTAERRYNAALEKLRGHRQQHDLSTSAILFDFKEPFADVC